MSAQPDSIYKLYGMYPPCHRSGFCCKQAPCSYGEHAKDGSHCVHLRVTGKTPGGLDLHECSIASWIMQQVGSGMYPAFGGGCPSILFNEARNAILKEALEKPRVNKHS